MTRQNTRIAPAQDGAQETDEDLHALVTNTYANFFEKHADISSTYADFFKKYAEIGSENEKINEQLKKTKEQLIETIKNAGVINAHYILDDFLKEEFNFIIDPFKFGIYDKLNESNNQQREFEKQKALFNQLIPIIETYAQLLQLLTEQLLSGKVKLMLRVIKDKVSTLINKLEAKKGNDTDIDQIAHEIKNYGDLIKFEREIDGNHLDALRAAQFAPYFWQTHCNTPPLKVYLTVLFVEYSRLLSDHDNTSDKYKDNLDQFTVLLCVCQK